MWPVKLTKWLMLSRSSGGTQEPLSLAIWLGLIRTLGPRSACLPLMMNDVVVNANSERARAVAAALENVARDHQILDLTHHPEHAAYAARSPG